MLDPSIPDVQTSSSVSPFQCYIAGMPYSDDGMNVLAQDHLHLGDEVFLEAEPYNRFDPNALKVLFRDKTNNRTVKLGYIPKQFCQVVQTLKPTTMVVTKIDPTRRWKEVKIEIPTPTPTTQTLA